MHVPSPASRRSSVLSLLRSVTLALCAGAGLPAPLHAALRWDATEAALHVRAEDAIGRTTFSYVNDGDTVVDISSVVPGCGCTAALPSKTHLAPGEKGELPVEFHRGNREGTFRLSIAVYHSAADTPTLLTLNVDIEALVRIEPRFIFWKAGEPRDARSVQVELLSAQSVKIVEVVCGNPLFTAKLVPVANRERVFDLVVTPPNTETTFSSVTLRTQVGRAGTERIYTLLARTL